MKKKKVPMCKLLDQDIDDYVGLRESLEAMEEIYTLAIKRMKYGVKVHGTRMIRKPFEELREELADAFNYICMGYIKVLKACGGYKETWSTDRLPDVQGRKK